ncbi:MAG: Xylulose kinase [Candidatus Magnetoglobus multicellularis str. Araruama]|uniref:Xylulose kinase n=1 Tax=Candidatus Magnetoglobus multicellularis str. Araruama TaxID=890399 RepID=A0A1V1PIR6_9BACT|nr:MAG: Xylulose kinase [Candidatus Magnetoglobus multicellularis str. Araruama]
MGTSGPKIAIISMKGDIIDNTVESIHLLLKPDGGAEQDPDEWWIAIKRGVHRILASDKVSKDQIVAICCTTQWSGTVPVDKQGNHLMNAIIWMDSRGAPYVRQLTAGWPDLKGYGMWKAMNWIYLTGGIPTHSGKDSIAHILYIKNDHPDIYDQTHQFLEPKDYLNYRLTGEFASSYDAIALHWLTDNRNINKISYSSKLIDWTGLDREKLPDLKASSAILSTILPEVADELGLSRHTKVVMGSPDMHAAAVGSGAVENYKPHLYLGTSSWMTCHVPSKKTDIAQNMASLPSAIPGKYFIAAEQETAGACINHLRDNLLFPDDPLAQESGVPDDFYDRLEKAASSVSPLDQKVLFTPWLYGERTPFDDNLIRAGFYNISLHTRRAHMVRAVFEGVAFNARCLLKGVESFTGQTMDCIHIIGGGAQSDLWCQIHADVLDRVIKQISDPVLANARGAGFIAAIALNELDWDDIGDCIKIQGMFHPDPKYRNHYEAMFDEFMNIYTNNRDMYHRLNDIQGG